MSAIDNFIEEMGLISQENGEARISGRILGLLVVEGREMSLSQISERLSVSRASVSTNARMLAQRGLLKLTARAGDRQDYYQATPTMHHQMLERLATQARRNAASIMECVKGIESEDPAAAQRVQDLQYVFEKSASILAHWASVMRDDAAPRKEPK